MANTKFHPKNNRYKDQYSFKTSIIDMDSIANECTKENPMLVVDVLRKGDSGQYVEKIVLIYFTIFAKLDIIDYNAIVSPVVLGNIDFIRKIKEREVKSFFNGRVISFHIPRDEESVYRNGVAAVINAPFNRRMSSEVEVTVKSVKF